MHMLITAEAVMYVGRICEGNTTFWIRLELSTRQLVARLRDSAKAVQTMIPASMTSETSRAPCSSPHRVLRITRKTKVKTSRLMIGKRIDQKNPMLDPT